MAELSEASCGGSPSRVGVRSLKSSSRFSIRERFRRGSSSSPEPERSKPGRQSEDRQDREDREEQLNQLRGEKFQLGVRLRFVQ